MFPTTKSRMREESLSLAAFARTIAGFCLLLALVLTYSAAHAEGSRTLYPAGSLSSDAGGTPGAVRSTLYRSDSVYMGTIRQQNFFYVYAQAGEFILLGTSGNRSALRLFAPPAPGQSLQDRFGVPGLEDPGSLGASLILSGTGCSNNSANIGSRAAELAGPNSADGSATVTNGYAPCYYQVPTGGTGIYGVFFGTSAIQMWDVTVRSSISSMVDINGRLFSYSFAGDTGGTNARTYATHYYVTDDGYRYSQTMRGLAPFRYVLYSNPQGFLDIDGDPLYRNVRGVGHTMDTHVGGDYFRPLGTGIQAQRPTYPMFFVNVMAPGVDTGAGLQATLTALGIPLAPAHPVALSALFQNSYTGGTTTYVGQGGVFTISTENALTYQILIKAGSTPEYDDPAHLANRTLTGIATGLNQQVYWDGLDNSGVPMPPGSGYSFEVTGRAGEVHFPFLDAEANLSGGPTVTRLNGAGANDSTVYYDDRGYAANGINVGTPNGNICDAPGNPGPANLPSPDHSLTGIDSNDANLNGTGNYYRSWGTAPNIQNPGTDCGANGYYGDAKGLDLWALIKSDLPPGTLALHIIDFADVTAQVSVPASAAPGATVALVASFGNVGSKPADGTVYSIQLPANLAGGVSCTGATCSYDPATGLVTIAGLPTSLSPGQWTGSLTLEYTAPASGSVPVSATVTTTSTQPTPPNPQAADTASGTTVVSGGGGTNADVLAQLAAPLTAGLAVR